jgi:CheY-like chemotaxis protein
MQGNNWHVLVVEDDADGQVVMTTLLEHLGISMDVASDSAEAEQFLFQSNNIYNAAIIDLALPDKDGWQLLALIQDNSQTASLPCIAVSAYHNSKLREDAILSGFKAYFPKPIDGTTFLRELERML